MVIVLHKTLILHNLHANTIMYDGFCCQLSIYLKSTEVDGIYIDVITIIIILPQKSYVLTMYIPEQK